LKNLSTKEEMYISWMECQFGLVVQLFSYGYPFIHTHTHFQNVLQQNTDTQTAGKNEYTLIYSKCMHL